MLTWLVNEIVCDQAAGSEAERGSADTDTAASRSTRRGQETSCPTETEREGVNSVAFRSAKGRPFAERKTTLKDGESTRLTLEHLITAPGW